MKSSGWGLQRAYIKYQAHIHVSLTSFFALVAGCIWTKPRCHPCITGLVGDGSWRYPGCQYGLPSPSSVFTDTRWRVRTWTNSTSRAVQGSPGGRPGCLCFSLRYCRWCLCSICHGRAIRAETAFRFRQVTWGEILPHTNNVLLFSVMSFLHLSLTFTYVIKFFHISGRFDICGNFYISWSNTCPQPSKVSVSMCVCQEAVVCVENNYAVSFTQPFLGMVC